MGGLVDQLVSWLVGWSVGEMRDGGSSTSSPVCAHAEATDLTHVNILAELYMEAGRFTETHTLIQRTAEALAAAQVQSKWIT